MKRYKCQALVIPVSQADGARAAVLTGSSCRIVLRAHHPGETDSRLFSALISDGGDSPPGGRHLFLTVTVVGDDAAEYLSPGSDFTLWRGADVGHGVVTRRVFV
jgi:hypothetical protein